MADHGWRIITPACAEYKARAGLYWAEEEESRGCEVEVGGCRPQSDTLRLSLLLFFLRALIGERCSVSLSAD